MERAETVELDDSDWEVVATPHSVELMPAEAAIIKVLFGIGNGL